MRKGAKFAVLLALVAGITFLFLGSGCSTTPNPLAERPVAEDWRSLYRYVGNFSEGLAWVMTKEGERFHIDYNGTPAYAERYAYAGNFYEGRAWMRTKDGEWFHIDRDGKQIE